MHAFPALFKAKPGLQAQLLGPAGTKLFASSHSQTLLLLAIKPESQVHFPASVGAVHPVTYVQTDLSLV